MDSDRNRDTERVICTSRPENERGFLILFVLLAMFGFSVFVATIEGSVVDFFVVMLIWLLPYYLLFTELMWQFAGKETVSLTREHLIILRTHKVFRGYKRIPLTSIRQIDKWTPSAIRSFSEATSVSGRSQWTLCVINNTPVPFKFGPRLPEEEQERVIAEIEAAVKQAQEEMWWGNGNYGKSAD